MKTRWQKIEPSRREPSLVHPYYEWALRTNFAYYGKAQWLPVLLELAGATAADFAQRVNRMRGQQWAGLLRVPAIYASPPARLKKARFLTALARKDFLTALSQGSDPSGNIRRFELGRSLEVPSAPTGGGGLAPAEPGEGSPPRGMVVTAVIDDGIAFAHQRFRSAAAATRIEYFWDQTALSTNPLPDWDYGNELEKPNSLVDGIDKRLADCSHAGLVDEDELYRRSGHSDFTQRGHKPVAQRGAHGTHVMDLACNALAASGSGPIIAVQLPAVTTADTSGATLAPQVLDALWYVADRADKIAARQGAAHLPVVINLSYGMLAGPHDGTGEVEAAIDDFLLTSNADPKLPPVRVVLPAGNNHLSRCHAAFTLKRNAKLDFELAWRVQPDDWTESFVEIWLPELDDSHSSSSVQVVVATPAGDVTPALSVDMSCELLDAAGGILGRVDFYPAALVSPTGRCKLIKLSLAPTGWPEPGLPLAPAGLWRVMLRNTGAGEIKGVHAWVQRDDAAFGYPRRGRQSYFDDPRYQRHDNGGRAIEVDNVASYVKREGTINAIATGAESIVIGGFRRSDWKPARYSAAGPVAHFPPGRGGLTPRGPDAMSVSDDTPSQRGVLAAGARSGSAIAMYGTSVSAPQIARWVAGELAAGRPGDRRAVAQFAQTGNAPPIITDRNPPPGAAPKPAPERGGFGRIEPPEMMPALPNARVKRFER